MTKVYLPQKTKEEMLTALQSGNGFMINLFDMSKLSPEDHDEVCIAACKLDGRAVKHIIRARKGPALAAVNQNAHTIALLSPRLRGAGGVTSVPGNIQYAAFKKSPDVLLWYPEKFDELLEEEIAKRMPDAHAQGVLEFSQQIVAGFGEEENPDAPLTATDKDNIRSAFEQFMRTGSADLPCLSWFQRQYPQFEHVFKLLPEVSDDHGMQVRMAQNLVATGKIQPVMDYLAKTQPDAMATVQSSKMISDSHSDQIKALLYHVASGESLALPQM